MKTGTREVSFTGDPELDGTLAVYNQLMIDSATTDFSPEDEAALGFYRDMVGFCRRHHDVLLAEIDSE